MNLNCIKTFQVLEDPPPDKEGLVALGLIVAKWGHRQNNFLGLEAPHGRHTELGSITDVSKIIFMSDQEKDIEGDGNYRFKWVTKFSMGREKSKTPQPYYFALSQLPREEMLFLKSASYSYLTYHHYTYRDANGNVHTATRVEQHWHTVPIDSTSTEKETPRFSNLGGKKIHFLGNFIAHPINPTGGNDRTPYNGTYVLTDINQYIAKNRTINESLLEMYYGKEEISRKGAEIHFLKRFIVENRSRYWGGIAIKQLLELDPATKNTVEREKIKITSDVPETGID